MINEIVATDNDIENIWSGNNLRFFISHRDKHKKSVTDLASHLKHMGISCFVAHESIYPTTNFKEEIIKALKTMDALLCYITEDFYDSVWTNQEIGFALSRGIPIFQYSVDGSNPEGFLNDIQAVKGDKEHLVRCIKEKFSCDENMKRQAIQNFLDAKDGTFVGAKAALYNLIDFTFNDQEIEDIVGAFSSDAKYMNQLHILFTDSIDKQHRKHPKLKGLSDYRSVIERLLDQQSSKRFFLCGNQIEKLPF